MISESSFDEAVAKPFLGEPAKKRWSLFPSHVPGVDDTEKSTSSRENKDASLDVSYRGEYQAPHPVLEVTFGTDDDEEKETDRLLALLHKNSESGGGEMEMETVDKDLAFAKKQGGFQVINNLKFQLVAVSQKGTFNRVDEKGSHGTRIENGHK